MGGCIDGAPRGFGPSDPPGADAAPLRHVDIDVNDYGLQKLAELIDAGRGLRQRRRRRTHRPGQRQRHHDDRRPPSCAQHIDEMPGPASSIDLSLTEQGTHATVTSRLDEDHSNAGCTQRPPDPAPGTRLAVSQGAAVSGCVRPRDPWVTRRQPLTFFRPPPEPSPSRVRINCGGDTGANDILSLSLLYWLPRLAWCCPRRPVIAMRRL